MTYLPDIYKWFKRQFPETAEAHDGLAVEYRSWGPPDEKKRRLTKLGIAIGLSSEGGVRSRARRVIEEGVAAEEFATLCRWRLLRQASRQ